MESYKLNLLRKMLACDALVELVLNELKKVSGELEKLMSTENITQEYKKKVSHSLVKAIDLELPAYLRLEEKNMEAQIPNSSSYEGKWNYLRLALAREN